jgi:hypothetical protein
MTAERGWLIELAGGTVCGPVTGGASAVVCFWVATDDDERGAAAAKYWLGLVGEQGERVLPPSGAKDVGDAWQAGADLQAWAMGFLPLP